MSFIRVFVYVYIEAATFHSRIQSSYCYGIFPVTQSRQSTQKNTNCERERKNGDAQRTWGTNTSLTDRATRDKNQFLFRAFHSLSLSHSDMAYLAEFEYDSPSLKLGCIMGSVFTDFESSITRQPNDAW